MAIPLQHYEPNLRGRIIFPPAYGLDG